MNNGNRRGHHWGKSHTKHNFGLQDLPPTTILSRRRPWDTRKNVFHAVLDQIGIRELTREPHGPEAKETR